MVDLSPFAVPHTLARLLPLLPPAPAHVVEAGCGRGALAAALAAKGYRVTGVDPDEEACAAAAARGVDVICADIRDVSVEPAGDVVLFTRSLHHVEHLAATVAHAAALVRPGGMVVLEEFARERVDVATAGFLYDGRSLLVAAGALEAPEDAEPQRPDENPLERWERERGAASERPLHTGSAMVDALIAAGLRIESTVDTETLWRLLATPSWTWTVDERRTGAVLDEVRQRERRRIAEGTLRPVGMLVAARRPQSSPSRRS
jgi:SAM-dependent methyltransferase